MFPSGDSIRFYFETNFDKKAVDASFKLDFDLELILEFVLNDNIYKGNEYNLYLKELITQL